MNPAQRMRRAALLLSRLADEAQDDLDTNAYWNNKLTDRQNWWARGMRNALGGPPGELAALLNPITVRAFADWLHVAADYAEKWPWEERQSSPFRAQALVVADYVLDTANNCPRCDGDGVDPYDQGEYNPEMRQYDPSTRQPCPACNGTGKRSDPSVIQCKHCEHPIIRKSLFYDGHPNNPPVWLHEDSGERACRIDWPRHDPHPVAKPRSEA